MIVGKNGLHGIDPIYTTIFNKIADHELFNYRRGESLNRGDVYSLAYAALNGIPFLTIRDGAMIKVIQEITELNNLEVFGFENLLVIGWLKNLKSQENDKKFRSLYKTYCDPAIKQNLIPKTFNLFLNSL